MVFPPVLLGFLQETSDDISIQNLHERNIQYLSKFMANNFDFIFR